MTALLRDGAELLVALVALLAIIRRRSSDDHDEQ
jgi:hypothetical protein